MNSIQNIVLFAVVITYLKKYSPLADLLPHTFGVTPWNKKKEVVLIPLIFLSFSISSYFIYLFIYLFFFFF